MDMFCFSCHTAPFQPNMFFSFKLQTSVNVYIDSAECEDDDSQTIPQIISQPQGYILWQSKAVWLKETPTFVFLLV